MPPVCGQHLGHDLDTLGMSSQQILEPFLAMPVVDCGNATAPSRDLWLTVASYNVLTLSCGVARRQGKARELGLAMQVAKPFMLAKSLEKAGLNAIAVQESRCGQGVVSTGGFLRFCSGQDNGSFGTEWWFREGHCAVRSHDGGCDRILFRKDCFCVKHADPRRMRILSCFHMGGSGSSLSVCMRRIVHTSST